MSEELNDEHPVILYNKEFEIICKLKVINRLPSIRNAISDCHNEDTMGKQPIKINLDIVGFGNQILYTEEYMTYIFEYIEKLIEFEKKNIQDIREKNIDMSSEEYGKKYLKDFNKEFMKYLCENLEKKYGTVENEIEGELPAIDHIFFICHIVNFMGFEEMLHMIRQYFVNSITNTSNGVEGLIKFFNYRDPETGDFAKPFKDPVIGPHLPDIEKLYKETNSN